MIKDIIKIHDKFSIEIKLIYDTISDKRMTNYDVLTYIFTPDGININPKTYTKEKFYNDVKVNIRYKTPEYKLSDFIDKENGVLYELEKIIRNNKLNTKKQSDKIYTQSKLFGSIFSSAIRYDLRKARKNISKNNFQEFTSIDSLVKQILKKYRSIIDKYDNTLYENDLRLLLFTDEFLSNAVEHNYIMLFDYLKKKKKVNIDSVIFQSIIKTIDNEQEYRRQNQYKTVPNANGENEELLYVRSQLKKYIDSVLFLKKEIKKDGAIIEQSIFALVAGLAMLFSTTVAFYYQQKYGNFTLPFFFALIISYMLKDRIKSLVGYLFVHKAHNVFYDNKLNIFSNEKNKVGIIKQNFRFVPSSKLGPKVKKHRMKERLFKNDYEVFGENIIQYKKSVKIFKRRLKKGIDAKKVNGLVDITRVNLHRFVLQMDNPEKDYSVIENNKIIKKRADRVYHINIIQKFYTEEGVEFKRFRVILNREGIKRIEKVQLDNLI